MVYVWIGAIVVFMILELATPQLVGIWFALGALGAMIAALLSASLWIQVVVFLIVSVVMLIVTRPLYGKFIKTKQVPTNSDMLIGESAIVIEAIDNIEATGTVKVKGQIWSARASAADSIPAGTLVTVERIEGVKLIVKQNEQ